MRADVATLRTGTLNQNKSNAAFLHRLNHELPRRSQAGVGGPPPITDTKA